MAFVYLIENTNNAKLYVGKTVKPILTRFTEHVRESATSDRFLYRAMRKYGPETFSIRVLEECEIEEVFDKEIEWVSKLGSLNPRGYNMTPGGAHGAPHLSPTFSRSMIEYHANKPKEEYATCGMAGKIHSEETRQKQSQARQRQWDSMTLKERRLRGNKLKGSKNGMTGKTPKNAVRICFDGVKYESVTLASRSTGHSAAFLKKYGITL